MKASEENTVRTSIAGLVTLLCASAALALNTASIPQANSHDDAWEAQWAQTMKNVHDAHAGMTGLVVHVGDSITYANPYGQNQGDEDLPVEFQSVAPHRLTSRLFFDADVRAAANTCHKAVLGST